MKPRNPKAPPKRGKASPLRRDDSKPQGRSPRPTMAGAKPRPQAVRPAPPTRAKAPTGLWFWGHHAVRAALLNPRRTLHQLMATAEGLERLGAAGRRAGLRIVPAGNEEIARFVPDDAQHQGVALQTAPLPPVTLERLIASQPGGGLLLVLDQITDPRNFGAILRTAAALGVGGVIVPDRRSAELGGAAAKAASGALDLVPVAEVVNLARTLQQLQKEGYWITGLDGAADRVLADSGPAPRRAVVMGSEGTGLRRLVAAACDELVKIPIEPRMESLNVSVAAGIALYELAGIDLAGRG